MTLHLLKLCVGADSVEDLTAWQAHRLGEMTRQGRDAELVHVTRQTPRREGFAPGSSLYWVIGGFIRVRQTVTAIRQIRGDDGINRCGLVFDPKLVLTQSHPRRPFQGWRYLPADEAPLDLDVNQSVAGSVVPHQMRAALAELRLL